MYDGIGHLVLVIYLYLDNKITGRQFVSEVDHLVSSDQINSLPEKCLDEFDKLHENLSLCVWDDKTYDDSVGLYISEEELRETVEHFIQSWGALFSNIICKK